MKINQKSEKSNMYYKHLIIILRLSSRT